MTLRSKWIDLLFSVATGSRKKRNIYTPVGALIYALLILLFITLSLYLDDVIGLAGKMTASLHVMLSLPVFTVALVLIGWSVYHFLRVKGTPVPFNPPPQLVVSGPYAYTRNPMLTGVFALLFGFGLFLGSVFLLFVFTPFFIFINYWELKAIEEPELVKRLGQDYVKYRKKTPMFFPDLSTILKRKK